MNSVASLTADGQSHAHVGNNFTFNLSLPASHQSDDDSSLRDDESLLRQLYVTDPFHDLQGLKRRGRNPVRGTCEWILTTQSLQKWINCPGDCFSTEVVSQVLWLHGNPGQGKSTLATYMIETLSARLLTDSKKFLAYFICDSDDYETRTSSKSILRGLLWHFYNSYPELIPEYARRRYRQLKKGLFDDFGHLWTLFMETAKANISCQLYCIIDGLDECDEESRYELLSQIGDIFSSSDRPSNINLLILSRPYVQIREFLGQFENHSLTSFPQLKQDINLYIDHELGKLAEMKSYPRVLREKVNCALRAKAEDTFLWVRMACQELRRIASVDALSFLERLPRKLEAFYSKVFNSILGPDAPQAAETEKILCFVATALRPMTLLELSEACGFDTEEDDETRTQFLRDRVGKCLLIIDIVTITDNNTINKAYRWRYDSIKEAQLEGERVVLLHQTVKDYYFTFRRGQLNIGEQHSHAVMTYRCLDELIKCLSEKRGIFFRHGNFLRYSICYWPYHARLAQSSFKVRVTHASFFSDPSSVRDEWLEQRLQYTDVMRIAHWHSVQEKLPLLNVAALWGIPSLVDYVSHSISQGVNIHSEMNIDPEMKILEMNIGEEFSALKSPLIDAVEGGCIHTFRRLLRLGLPLTAFTIKSAVIRERREILDTLLEIRSDEIVQHPNLQKSSAASFNATEMLLLMDHPGFTITESTLHGAMANEDHRSEVLGLLLPRSGMEPRVLLQQTITESSTASIKFLIDQFSNDLDIDSTLVAKAAENREFGLEIIDLLFQRFPNINITDDSILAIFDLGELGARYISNVLEVLFERLGPEFRVTNPVLLGAARAEMEDDEEGLVFQLILQRASEKLEITHDVVMAVAQNSNAWVAMPLLLSCRGAEVRITEEILCAAIPNLEEVYEPLLRNVVEHSTQITAITMAAAARVSSWKGFLQILETAGTDIRITQNVLVAAASNTKHGFRIVWFLLGESLNADEISTLVLEEVLRNHNWPVMSVILKRRGEMINLSKDLLQTWVSGEQTSGKALKYLLQYKAIEVNNIVDTMSTNEQAEFVGQRERLFNRFEQDSWDDLFRTQGR